MPGQESHCSNSGDSALNSGSWIPDQVRDDENGYAASAGSTVSRSPIAPRIERIVSNDGFPSSPSAL
jgi:hypothetical protein